MCVVHRIGREVTWKNDPVATVMKVVHVDAIFAKHLYFIERLFRRRFGTNSGVNRCARRRHVRDTWLLVAKMPEKRHNFSTLTVVHQLHTKDGC